MSEKLGNDEISLIDLSKTLLKNKWKIAASAMVCAGITAGYAFLAKEQWTSKATIIEPTLTDANDYVLQRSEYANILDVKDFNNQEIIRSLFSKFKTALFSSNIKREFFEQSEWFKKYAKENANMEQEKIKLLSELIEKKLVISFPDPKKNANAIGVTISFSTEIPSNAQMVLSDYINFVNNKLIQEENRDFTTDINLSINNLELQKNKLERNTESVKDIQIQNLSTALSIAKEAGIKEYTKSISNNVSLPEVVLGDAKIPFTDSKLSDGSYLFMLGEKYLQAQLDTLKNNQLIYPVSYYTMTKQIALLKQLEQEVSMDKDQKSYYYLSSPDYPTQRDWPKRVILILLGFVLGGVISSVTILVKDLFGRK
ncbi:MAG: Wzz/FepE/Etk N-terminal domain-containing protein [Pasteurellaceae bacterium]|nr:Wzz/FepE/Etk N-terminal domain-containing protein [Pasteurellaceae bacterium]